MLTKFKGFPILIYIILSQRACNLIEITYLITDSIQQIHKIGFLVYYLDLNQLFISLASSFQYVLIYARVFFVLQAKFSLKYKTALASGLNNSLQNLKFQTIFAFSSELFFWRQKCVCALMAWLIPSCRAEGVALWQQLLCPELPAEGGLCSGNSRDLPSLSWLLFLTWAPPERDPCGAGGRSLWSLGMLHCQHCQAKAFRWQYHFFWSWRKVPSSWSWKSEVNISSMSCNKVLEIGEGLLTSEDIKSPNFQEKSRPSAGGEATLPFLAVELTPPLPSELDWVFLQIHRSTWRRA